MWRNLLCCCVLITLIRPTFAESTFPLTCSEIHFAYSGEEATIQAVCLRANGSPNATSLTLQGISNQNGVLRQENGPSTFQHSCGDIRLVINGPTVILSAECRTTSGTFNATSLKLDSISNNDGNLTALGSATDTPRPADRPAQPQYSPPADPYEQPSTPQTSAYLGEVRLFAFNFCPSGWSPAAGQLPAINRNQALFSLLGTTYGGNGATNFALPNLVGRAPYGFGNSPGQPLGATYGGLPSGGGSAALAMTWCASRGGIYPVQN